MIPDEFDTWPEEAKQEYFAAMAQMGYSPRVIRASGTRKSTNRQSETRRSGQKGQKSGRKSGRKSGTKSGRKSQPKNRTWKEYFYEHSGKAAALASLVAIVASIVATAPAGTLLSASAIYNYLLTSYGANMAALFSSNSAYIMSKVGGMASTVSNLASSALGYGQQLFGYGQKAAALAQTAQMGLHGTKTMYAAGQEIAEGLGGDEIDTAKLMGAVGKGMSGLNTLSYARAGYNNQQAAFATQEKNALVMDCKSIMKQNPNGPYTPEEEQILAQCDAMLQQQQQEADMLRRQQEEEAQSKYGSLAVEQSQPIGNSSYAMVPYGQVQNPHAMVPYGVRY